MINFKKMAIGFGLVSMITLQGLQANKLKECESEADKKTGCVEIEEWQERMSYGSIETLYKNGKKESIKDYRNGELEFETLYKYTKEGYTEYYYGYGTLLGVTPYKNGKLHGIKKYYYENGKIKSETPYKNGKLHGIEKYYYENGNLMGEATFKNSDEKGYEAIMKYYYESGKLKTEMTVKNDCLDGVAKYYYESGNVKEELTPIVDGQYDDKFYTEDGNLLGVVRYNGKAIESVKCAKKKLSDKEAKEIREKFIQLKLENRKSSEQQDEHEFIKKHCK